MSSTTETIYDKQIFEEWPCLHCGKSNVPFSQFCGSCGEKRGSHKKFPEPDSRGADFQDRMTTASSSHLIIKLSGRVSATQPGKLFRARGGEFDTSEAGKIPPNEIVVSNEIPFKRSALVKSRKKGKRHFASKRRCKQMIRLFLVSALLFSVFPILVFGHIAQDPSFGTSGDQVKWGDFRSYMSRKLGLTLGDVDEMISRIFKQSPDPETIVDMKQIQSLRAFLADTKLKHISLFSWVSRKGPLKKIQLLDWAEPAEDAFFDDVPTDHPLYRAWKPLFSLGIPLSCLSNKEKKEKRACPYDSLRWEEWNSVLELVWGILYENADLENLPGTKSEGIIGRKDYENQVTSLYSMFQVPPQSLSGRTREKFPPTRMEAFTLLGELLTIRMAK